MQAHLHRNYDEPFYAADDFCCAARRALGGQSASLHTLMMTLGLAGLMIVSYGFIGSLTWILIPMLVHAVVDAVSMPASQLAVGTASGETAIAAGQGLFGATGLIIAAISSVGGGYVYQEWG